MATNVESGAKESFGSKTQMDLLVKTGKYKDSWQIDHIIPCNSFDLTKPEEQERCFHYTIERRTS